jgi:hypothetical protein
MGEVALHDLHVVEVELQPQIGVPDPLDDRIAWVVVLRKYPGMSRVLIGSITTVTPSAASRSAVCRKFAT